METSEVKKLLQIKMDKYDEYLNAVVPLIVDFAKEYCNQSFTDDSGSESLPGGVKLFVAKAAEYLMNPAGVNSRSAPGTGISYEMDFPASILKLLRPYRRVKFV